MITSLRPARGQHRQTRSRPVNDVLITTAADDGEASYLRKILASAIVKMNLQGEFGVSVHRSSSGWYGVYLGRHDGQPVKPTDAVVHAAARFGRSR